MPEELKVDACRKCGSETTMFTKNRWGEIRVECCKCGKRGPLRRHKETAAKAWNEGRKK